MQEQRRLGNIERYGRRVVAGLSAFAIASCGVEAHGKTAEEPRVEASGDSMATTETLPALPLPDFVGLRQIWDTELGSNVGEVDVAIMDLHSGESMHTSSTATPERFYAASVMKLSILVETLRRYQERGLPVSICGDNANQWLDQCQALDIAYPMITVSDNDSASQLFVQTGGAAGMQSFFERIGATDTTASSSWGLTLTTASDQLKVVRAAVEPGNILDKQYVDAVRDLLRHVDPSQAWGVGSGVQAEDARVEVKNGWIPDLEGTYNSVGYAYREDGSIEYTLAIMMRHGGGEQLTKDTMQRLSAYAYETMVRTTE